jgi:hypothetical protein
MQKSKEKQGKNWMSEDRTRSVKEELIVHIQETQQWGQEFFAIVHIPSTLQTYLYIFCCGFTFVKKYYLSTHSVYF